MHNPNPESVPEFHFTNYQHGGQAEGDKCMLDDNSNNLNTTGNMSLQLPQTQTIEMADYKMDSQPPTNDTQGQGN